MGPKAISCVAPDCNHEVSSCEDGCAYTPVTVLADEEEEEGPQEKEEAEEEEEVIEEEVVVRGDGGDEIEVVVVGGDEGDEIGKVVLVGRGESEKAVEDEVVANGAEGEDVKGENTPKLVNTINAKREANNKRKIRGTKDARPVKKLRSGTTF